MLTEWVGPNSHHQPNNHLKKRSPPDWDLWRIYWHHHLPLPFARSFLCLTCIFNFWLFSLFSSSTLLVWIEVRFNGAITGTMDSQKKLAVLKVSRANSRHMGCMLAYLVNMPRLWGISHLIMEFIPLVGGTQISLLAQPKKSINGASFKIKTAQS